MLFIYFISKASTQVALTLWGLEGRSCWAPLGHPSSLSPRVCPEEPETQSPFCLYTETINIKTSLQTLPRRSPFSSQPDRPPQQTCMSPSPRTAASSQPRPNGGSSTTRATPRVDCCDCEVPLSTPHPAINWKHVGLPLTSREGKARGEQGAADSGGGEPAHARCPCPRLSLLPASGRSHIRTSPAPWAAARSDCEARAPSAQPDTGPF